MSKKVIREFNSKSAKMEKSAPAVHDVETHPIEGIGSSLEQSHPGRKAKSFIDGDSNSKASPAPTAVTASVQRPTESELDILKIIWSEVEATVRQVHEKIAEHKQVGYTTTLKLMQIMHNKGILQRNTDSRTHIYSAAISRDKTLKQLVSKLIDTAFSGSAFDLVNYILEHKKIGKKETEALRKHFKSGEKKGK